MILKCATWRPVAYQGLQLRTPNAAVVFHTNGAKVPADGSLYAWWSSQAKIGSQLGAHLQVANNGKIEQYVDTKYRIGHAWAANSFTVGIEFEDDANPSKPYTDAQLASAITICKELKVPAVLLSEWPSIGVGWHEQYPSWDLSGHLCPGGVRENQIKTIIIPALKVTPPPAKADEMEDLLCLL